MGQFILINAEISLLSIKTDHRLRLGIEEDRKQNFLKLWEIIFHKLNGINLNFTLTFLKN